MGNFAETDLARMSARRPAGSAGTAPDPAREYAAWLDCLADMAQVLTPASVYRERPQCFKGQSLRATAP